VSRIIFLIALQERVGVRVMAECEQGIDQQVADARLSLGLRRSIS
jgi:hypothetical protein